MKNFEYTARDEYGDKRVGLRQADSKQNVLGWLREQGFVPISVKVVKTRVKNERLSSHRRVKSEDMASFCWQLNTMIEGGVSVADSFDVIAEDIVNLQFRKAICQVSEEMKSGEAFSDSITKHPQIFNSLFRAMIMAGEAGGTMPTVLQRLARYYDGRDKLARKVKGALSYPIFVSGFVVLIVVAMMVFIIPRFREIFKSIKGEMPAFTKAFMSVYDSIMHNGIYYLGIVALAVTVLIVYSKTPKGHFRVSKFVLSIPFLGKLLTQSFISMFCRTMATLLSAGVSVIETFDILANMTNNDIIKASIIRTKEHIMEGSNISLSMSSSGFFPNMVSKMTQVGEESGSLPSVLDRTSDYYEKKVDSAITAMTGFLEPAMIVIVGTIVLVVVLALYLPVFSLSNV
ncbi:type II secretion system F family protein [Planctomycetota bacterium]